MGNLKLTPIEKEFILLIVCLSNDQKFQITLKYQEERLIF